MSDFYFQKRGNAFFLGSGPLADIHRPLPTGTYVLKVTRHEELYLEEAEAFTLPTKVYGDPKPTAERILTTFESRKNTTGVLLSGEKGSGKTLLAKMVSVMGAERNLPTIIINSPMAGDIFNSFLASITQPCILLFDEFEKVYEDGAQQAILTLMDGVIAGRKLFLLTCNDPYKINSHMRNRPGRVFYFKEFQGLEESFVREYCADRLKATEHIDKVCMVAGLFHSFNFDMLQALVEEMNRYDETPAQALALLNCKPETEARNEYSVQLTINGVAIAPEDHHNDGRWGGNPLGGSFKLHYIVRGANKTAKTSTKSRKASRLGNATLGLEMIDPDWDFEEELAPGTVKTKPASYEDGDAVKRVQFHSADMTGYNTESGSYTFRNKDGEQVTLKRTKPRTFDYRMVL